LVAGLRVTTQDIYLVSDEVQFSPWKGDHHQRLGVGFIKFCWTYKNFELADLCDAVIYSVLNLGLLFSHNNPSRELLSSCLVNSEECSGVVDATYCRVDSLGISSSLCALDDGNVDDTGVDVLGLKPVSLGLGLCANRPEKNQCRSLQRLTANTHERE